jgi:hypothetical protein
MGAGAKGFEPLTTCLGGKCHIRTRTRALCVPAHADTGRGWFAHSFFSGSTVDSSAALGFSSALGSSGFAFDSDSAESFFSGLA